MKFEHTTNDKTVSIPAFTEVEVVVPVPSKEWSVMCPTHSFGDNGITRIIESQLTSVNGVNGTLIDAWFFKLVANEDVAATVGVHCIK